MNNIKKIAMTLTAVLGVGIFLVSGNVLLSQEPDSTKTPVAKSEQVIKTISLTNADIRSVMMYLASYSDINIVVSPQVDAEITMKLNNVTWRQALDIILDTYGLIGVESNNYIRVVKAEDYYKEKQALEQYNAEQSTLKNLQTKIIKIKYNVASEISKAVTGLLSKRGSVTTDDRTNSLVIRDLPEKLEKIEDLVGQLDQETKQVKISAQLLEVESRTLREMGFDYRALDGKGITWYDPYSTETPKVIDYWPNGDYQQNSTSQMAGDAIGNFMFATKEGNIGIKAILKLAESSNKVKVIAHPEVTTVDNVEAFIQMGQKIPIKQFDPSGNTIITFYDVGIQLKVTPHITSENRILLKLKPERSSYQFDPNGVIINTQNASTNVVVDNGQTAVIAGLTKQEELKLRVGIPILKDIPLLGYLFSYDKKEIQNNDLVIFVTPTIIGDQIAEY